MRITSNHLQKAGEQRFTTVKPCAQNAIFERERNMTEIVLRPWQVEAINKSISWFEEKDQRIFLIDAAPGAGKTICASVIAKELMNTHGIERVIVIAPRTEVVRQWADEFKTVTGKKMLRYTSVDSPEELDGSGIHICATWQSVEGMMDAFTHICKTERALIICDEHHHAAAEAVWGANANNAFGRAQRILVLSGTPTRSDGKEPIWFDYNDKGTIDHPEEGTYRLTYGEAVELLYCRPITFHRHEGNFSVYLKEDDDTIIEVSGNKPTKIPKGLSKISALQQELDFYKLARTPQFLEDGKTPDPKSYHATMLEWGVAKLDEIKNIMPNAAGLVIAPSIDIAQSMAKLLKQIDGEEPVVVHSGKSNAENLIASFKNNKKRWIVSVAMISEGVDIPRLRVLVYLPNAQTELAFRQAMGRVVRTNGPDDRSSAYVVMPTHKIFEEYARRVEKEMEARHRPLPKETKKICGQCGAENELDAKRCTYCDEEFPKRKPHFKECSSCGELSPIGSDTCQFCGSSFSQVFKISLTEALRYGAIIRGLDIAEEVVKEGEEIGSDIKKQIMDSGDPALIHLVYTLPDEAYGALANIIKTVEKNKRK